jgi:ABC-type nickel/cobalt efflux system permease component RcnA
MHVLSTWVADRRGLALVWGVSFLLGLRHATDPDHLTAIVTLLADRRRGPRAGAMLGLAWGLGHGVAFVALGLPLILLDLHLPERLQSAAEVAIGVMIAALSVRLFLRWKRGVFHAHWHRHGGELHAHPHVHADRAGHDAPHAHDHERLHERTPLAAFGIGLVHGIGGSAAAAAFAVTAFSARTDAVLALLVFSAGTLVAMGCMSALAALALVRGPLATRFTAAIPILACATLLFGVWYAVDSWR